MKTLGIIAFVSLFAILSLGNINRNELNEVALVYAIGIDREADNYVVSLQVINPQPPNSPSDKLPVVVYDTEAKSMGKAIEMVSRKISRQLSPAQVQLIIIGESVAETIGVNGVLNYILREPGLSSMLDILITKDINAGDALKVIPHMEDIPGSEIVKTLENTEENWGSHQRILPTQLKADILSRGVEAIIPTIVLIGDKKVAEEKGNLESIAPKAYLELSGLTVMNEDKRSGWLNDNQSRSYYLIKGTLKNSYFSSYCSDQKEEFGLTIIHSKTSIHGKVNNGIPKFKIKVDLIGDLDELNCEMDITKPEEIKKIETLMKKDIEASLKDLITQSQTLNCDFIGFGDILRIDDKSNWKKYEKLWQKEIFAKSQYEITANVTVRNYGDINISD
ncbi:Ger(x)C family spore germination protein [Niallia circulans]|uniref:Ger(X)C family spore germination protein n=1 Tax=Niallia circulans TaxID=1397 RepID=A0A553SS38_NIACI|nr:Ger(x)C family spore germination protein [Niallia circulans]TRZ39810.1 Ger(x)C family spore germination protein [Niallia circulans]